MNNEPVAWMDANDKTIISNEKKWANDIPLYTHSAKTLTDAEFDNIFANGKRLGVLETEDRFHKAKTLTDEEIVEIYNDILIHDKKSSIKFARAILKKASEK